MLDCFSIFSFAELRETLNSLSIQFLSVLQNLPAVEMPQVFGMHDNISISKELQETKQLCDNVLQTQGRNQRGTRASGQSDERLYLIANDVLKKAIFFIPVLVIHSFVNYFNRQNYIFHLKCKSVCFAHLHSINIDQKC
jgi:hypothetical protein